MKKPQGVLLTLIMLAGLAGCSRQQGPPGMPPPRVSIAQPQTLVVTNWDEFPGHLAAVEMVEIQPRVSGYVQSIHFEDGAEVKAGDLLFVIDPRPFETALERAQAEVKRAETRLELTGNDLRRAESLHGTRAISEEEYDSRGKAARDAAAALSAARAAEAATKLDLEYARITAPIPGKIGRRFVTPGNLVQGGGMVPGTVLTTLVSLDPVHCYFDVDERSFLRYRQEGLSRGSLPCELALDNEEGFPHQGQVDFFDNQVNRQTGTIRMRGVFANAERKLVPGLFAKVRILAGKPAEAMLIPDVAVLSDQDRKFVFVLNSSNIAEPRPVQLGRAHGALRTVARGLGPRDQVVVNGLLMVRPGVKVEVLQNPPGATGRP